MPVFAIFFPVEIAIATTAVVHLANNLFKIGLIWRAINLHVVLLFAIPAAVAAILGAILLNHLSSEAELATYYLGNKVMHITFLKLIISLLLSAFAIMELVRRIEKFRISRKYLPFGGALSGFFGGLSGHQGALRSVFLLKSGLSKEGFIATGIAAAIIIDI